MKTTSFAIAAAGAVGLVIILRAAGYYAGADGIAFCITLLMACAFGVGIAELLLVARRIGELQSELGAFPAAASHDHVTRASPLLRALLSARLDRTVLPVPGPTFAPFVVGLLVMLGLLGTFLGLFDTLRGAGQALTASTDIDALRAALKAPIGGLMRGFGTSAAGVASSAMLGLAMVFARREVSRLGVSLHAMASGPLARFTPAHRQLLALESLAEQGAAWPKAAAALGEAVETLKGLETSWASAHEQAAARTREQLAAAIEAIRSELQAAVAQGRELAGGAASALSELQHDWQRTHAQSAERTQEALRGTARQIGDTLARGIERTAEVTQAAVQPLLGAAGRELSQALQAHLHEVRAALGREAAEAADRAAALHVRIETAAEQAAERDTSRAALLARVAEEMQRELGQATSLVRERMQHSAEADRVQQVRAEALLGRLSEASAAIAAAAQQQVGALQQFVEATDGRLRDSEARAEARLQALLGRLVDLSDAQAARLAGFERELIEQHAGAAERLTERAAALSEQLQQEQEQTAALVKQAATLIHGGGIELAAVADAFAVAVDKQREGARAWLESLGDIERAVVEAGEAAAADVLGRHLSQTHELFDRQLEFQRELIDQLRTVRRDSMLQARVDAAE